MYIFKGYQNPGEHGIHYEDWYVTTSDGFLLHGWILKQKEIKNIPTILFFHGNAGNIGFRLPNAIELYHRLGVHVAIIDYRG